MPVCAVLAKTDTQRQKRGFAFAHKSVSYVPDLTRGFLPLTFGGFAVQSGYPAGLWRAIHGPRGSARHFLDSCL